MKTIMVLLLLPLFFSCAPKTGEAVTEPLYLKADPKRFPTCVMEHAECKDLNQYRVEVPQHLGQSRHCMKDIVVSQVFGCRVGTLIIQPDEPWRPDCLCEGRHCE